jgi:hypothetical protein
MDIIVYLINSLVIMIFFTSGASKLINFNKTNINIERYNLIPKRLVKPANIINIFLEFLLVALLFTKAFNYGLFISIVLLFLYSIAMVLSLNKVKKLDCGCGGILGNHEVSFKLVFRNLILILIFLSSLLVAQGINFNIFYQVIILAGSTVVLLLLLNVKNTYQFSSELERIRGENNESLFI